jgi:carotenoid cleavage dioxygenase-like enzyme
VKSDVVFAGEAEFPTINTTLNGRKNTFAYVAFKSKPHADTAIGFDGVRKVNMSDSSSFAQLVCYLLCRYLTHCYFGVTTEYNDFVLPDGFTCGEWWFVPRPKKSNSEDDGYLFTFAHDFSSSTSQLVIVDAVTLKLATRIKTPQRVPAGFHGTWVSAEQIANQVLNDY